MSKNVKCYNFTDVTRLLDIHTPGKMYELLEFLRLMDDNDVIVFQPPRSPGSCRARRLPCTYLKSNKWLDRYMREKNIWGVLKGKRAVKPGYKKYEEKQDTYVEPFHPLFTEI